LAAFPYERNQSSSPITDVNRRSVALVAVGHFFEHAEVLHLMSPKLEDMVIGWPTAALLALTGGVVYGT